MTLDAFLHQFASSLPDGSVFAFGIAFLAGIVASAVCPCTVPVGLGVAGVVGSSEMESRRSDFLIATAFCVGIVINLTILELSPDRWGPSSPSPSDVIGP
ncbi:MAG: hypothetical protein WD425_17550 [Nitrospirales bacterium]